MDEIQIKTKVVGFLYKRDPSFILACEVPFAYGARRADVISIYGYEATAFEIKSVGDKVSRLYRNLSISYPTGGIYTLILRFFERHTVRCQRQQKVGLSYFALGEFRSRLSPVTTTD